MSCNKNISPVGNHDRPMAYPSAAVATHTSKAVGDEGGPHLSFQYRGINFLIQRGKQGYFALVDMPDAFYSILNCMTQKPCSDLRAARYFAKRFIKAKLNNSLQYYKKEWWIRH